MGAGGEGLGGGGETGRQRERKEGSKGLRVCVSLSFCCFLDAGESEG